MSTISSYRIFLPIFLCFTFAYSIFAEKKAVFIIGTGRCGSSCTAGLLQILGLPLGDQLRPGIEGINPKGFFEDIETVEITKKLLQRMGALYVSPQFIDWNTHAQREWFKRPIKKYLTKQFSSFPLFGIKNPVIALFLPLYIESVQELGYTPKIIIINRETEETIKSWHKNFKNLSREHIIKSINCYRKAIDYYTPGYDFLILNFDDIINNTAHAVHQINTFLPELASYTEKAEEINSFIDKGLKHHNS